MQSLGDGALAILKFSKASCSLPLSAASARRTGRRCRSRMLFFWPERASLDNQAKTGQGQAEVGFAVAIVKSGLSSRAA